MILAADQEFLASFAVEIDEAGVARLRNILQENRELAESVAEAFAAAAKAIREYEQAASGRAGSGGEEDRDIGSGGAGQEKARMPTVREDVRSRLMGSLYGAEGSIRDWYLGNIEDYVLATASRDTAALRKSPLSWEQAGLPSDPAESERSAEYAALQEQAYDVLREPIARAREYMKQALEAEKQGTDTQQYADKVVETLREPLQKVKDLYDAFTFEDDTGSREDSGGGTEGILNLEAAREELEAFRKEAAEPVKMSGDASGIASAARGAFNSIRSMFSSPVTLTVNVVRNFSREDGKGEGGYLDTPVYRMSSGGRFSEPTEVQVAEDGDAEYIIPVKKEDRAVPLLRRLLGELSPAARESLGNISFAVQNAELMPAGKRIPSLSEGLQAGSASAGMITQNNQNVSAPVTIQVHASGVNAEKIGETVYNTAERYLLRTLRSAF